MRRGLLRLWSLPWPSSVRRLAERLIRTTWLHHVVLPHFLVGVVGLIENGHGELLLLHHTYRREYPWGLPTGFLEHREQPSKALAREILEETGFSVELSSLWRVYADADRPLLNVVFRGVYLGGDFKPSVEVREARFFASNALPAVLPDQRLLIESYTAEEMPH